MSRNRVAVGRLLTDYPR